MTEPRYQQLERPDDRLYLDHPDERAVPQSAAERALKEPLFNKKVMMLWAGVTLALYVAFGVVVPAVFDAVKSSLKEAVESAETAPDGTKIIKLKNGKTITITKNGHNGVTISTGTGSGTPAPEPVAAPAIPAGAAPAAPAPPAPAKK
ncbi:MAG TPA: hypothetical protein VF042_00410 [Gemmatimonadaceae bacterium]